VTLDVASSAGPPYSRHEMLQQNYAPIDQELQVDDLPVTSGSLPPGLEGCLYRNGPNPQFPPLDERHHWFFSEGMVHAIRVRGGSVSYSNRWVRTSQFLAQEKAGKRLISTASPAPANGFDPYFANTNAVIVGGNLYALEEGSLPMLLDPLSDQVRGACWLDGYSL
jgi:carotenoid cleavage dioxygenase-like enzyme